MTKKSKQEAEAAPQKSKNNLTTTYEFHGIERKWYKTWLEQKSFKATTDDKKPSFSIVIPPPNVTGILHIGHALNNTLQDILVRYRRMQGYNVLWLPGTDHAGIATQNIVEKQLAEEGINRHDLSRQKFIERVWQWKEESGGKIINQLKRLGCSCDWDKERFTMDEGLSRAVRQVFVQLYEEGLIYKGDYIINWCPRCHTALSDLEVEHEETDGKLYHIKYPLASGNGQLIVATTRPETMLGDTAVAVHPADERYNNLADSSVNLPLTNRTIPIIFDTHVEREFGTGALKVTPAHDINDFEIGRRHNLPMTVIMDDNGMINDNGGAYKGLERFKCREKIVADLEKQGLLVSIEEYQHGVGHCYRCHTVVEQTLSKQWFVSVKPLAAQAIRAVQNGEIRILPKIWDKTFYDWMNNIRDWCISRQIWWGHQIPAWTCTECETLVVCDTAPTKCTKCQSHQLLQETDVLDTWFSSALWPFSTLGWPEKTRDLKFFYPTSALITSFDILFFWVARMMMMGLHFMKEVPFSDVYLHALVRDQHGQKMSKSKGNVIDPLIVMDKFGTDALRFTMTIFAGMGRDIRLSEERISGYRNFINKIWNSARFALMHITDDDLPIDSSLNLTELSLPHQWILSRTNHTVSEVCRALDEFRFNDAASLIYQFVWHEFCDWYLEWIKAALYGDNQKVKEQGRSVLLTVLEIILKLLHPVTPFITEEIWHALPGSRLSIMEAPFPTKNPVWQNKKAEKQTILFMGIVTGLRNIRSEMTIHPSAEIQATIICHDPHKTTEVKVVADSIKKMARVTSLTIIQEGERPTGTASYIYTDIEIFVAMAGLVDINHETAKLKKEQEKIEVELKRVNGKLRNKNFLAKAPAAIINKEKEKLIDFNSKLTKIMTNITRLQELATVDA